MPDKQDRYRKRKNEQGFRRVEVIVPEELVSYLKAYARALRDTHEFGVEPPLFDGLGSRNRSVVQSVEQNIQTTTEGIEEVRQNQTDTLPPTKATPRKTNGPTKAKPDFSGGLLDK